MFILRRNLSLDIILHFWRMKGSFLTKLFSANECKQVPITEIQDAQVHRTRKFIELDCNNY